MIKALYFFDMDGTTINSPMPETGKSIYKAKTGNDYPHIGWWSKPESLDTNVFDIKPFPNVLKVLNDANSNNESYVVILTSRQHKLRSVVENVLNVNHIHVDKLDMKYDEKTKGEKVLGYLKEFPDVNEINVYDDRDSDIQSYIAIREQIPNNIKFNIYLANQGNLTLVENQKSIIDIINEEILKF